ncbi:e3 ubiquitin-protein ligase rbbp6 [Anaeramoeba flamelloides]|uniref:E3 ubiquitin-protein ligase rbbp6 n=1 Tax=Anaeramoeba flamelloides TaxID=1746091 RepID=A0AAV7Z7T0_9EUKA|nr:e3 ubiquitin-protein ligase rbbp6 [Anaeramoeba flamelloides]
MSSTRSQSSQENTLSDSSGLSNNSNSTSLVDSFSSDPEFSPEKVQKETLEEQLEDDDTEFKDSTETFSSENSDDFSDYVEDKERGKQKTKNNEKKKKKKREKEKEKEKEKEQDKENETEFSSESESESESEEDLKSGVKGHYTRSFFQITLQDNKDLLLLEGARTLIGRIRDQRSHANRNDLDRFELFLILNTCYNWSKIDLFHLESSSVEAITKDKDHFVNAYNLSRSWMALGEFKIQIEMDNNCNGKWKESILVIKKKNLIIQNMDKDFVFEIRSWGDLEWCISRASETVILIKDAERLREIGIKTKNKEIRSCLVFLFWIYNFSRGKEKRIGKNSLIGHVDLNKLDTNAVLPEFNHKFPKSIFNSLSDYIIIQEQLDVLIGKASRYQQSKKHKNNHKINKKNQKERSRGNKSQQSSKATPLIGSWVTISSSKDQEAIIWVQQNNEKFFENRQYHKINWQYFEDFAPKYYYQNKKVAFLVYIVVKRLFPIVPGYIFIHKSGITISGKKIKYTIPFNSELQVEYLKGRNIFKIQSYGKKKKQNECVFMFAKSNNQKDNELIVRTIQIFFKKWLNLKTKVKNPKYY